LSAAHVLRGWHLSLYSGKARAYLRYKGIAHVEKPPTAWTMFRTIKRKTGAVVLPVVTTPEGEWLQDTSDIMDTLERRFPEAPVVPPTPRQRIAAYVLEAWGDEFWLPSAMHYRWSFAENYGLFERDAGSHLLPFGPGFLQRRLAARSAGLMRSFLPGLGVVPDQVATIEAWTVAMLDLLDAHFAQQPYLLGSRPSYGDFGLVGPLYAHLGRDPYPQRTLIEPRRHLAAWVARMQAPAQPRGGDFLPGDEIPATLAPVFRAIFTEFWPQLEAIAAEVQKALPQLAPGRGLRRSLGEIAFPMGGRTYRRLATPYSLWMAQRALDAYRALAPAERAGVDAWLAQVGGAQAMQLAIAPRLQRIALRVTPEFTSPRDSGERSARSAG
jgi:glutathione S-transferase